MTKPMKAQQRTSSGRALGVAPRHIRTVSVTLPAPAPDPLDLLPDGLINFVSPETENVPRQALTTGGVDGARGVSRPAGEITDERYFGRTEIASTSTALVRAIDDCARFNGQGFFQNRRESRIEMFVLAYLLLLELFSGGEEAITLAIDRFPAGTRARRPSFNKPELIAVQLTAKPEDEPERKLCSDYASVLLVARVKGLSASEFVDWIEKADIGECKVRAKRIRTALRAGLPPEIDDEPDPARPTADEPWVQISHGRGQDVGGSYSASVAEEALSPVADVIEAGVRRGTLASVLRMVADALDFAQQQSSFSPRAGTVQNAASP